MASFSSCSVMGPSLKVVETGEALGSHGGLVYEVGVLL